MSDFTVWKITSDPSLSNNTVTVVCDSEFRYYPVGSYDEVERSLGYCLQEPDSDSPDSDWYFVAVAPANGKVISSTGDLLSPLSIKEFGLIDC